MPCLNSNEHFLTKILNRTTEVRNLKHKPYITADVTPAVSMYRGYSLTSYSPNAPSILTGKLALGLYGNYNNFEILFRTEWNCRKIVRE